MFNIIMLNWKKEVSIFSALMIIAHIFNELFINNTVILNKNQLCHIIWKYFFYPIALM